MDCKWHASAIPKPSCPSPSCPLRFCLAPLPMKCWDQRRSETFLETTGTKQLHPARSSSRPCDGLSLGPGSYSGKGVALLPQQLVTSQATPQSPVGCHYRLKWWDQAAEEKGHRQRQGCLATRHDQGRLKTHFCILQTVFLMWISVRFLSFLCTTKMSKHFYKFLFSFLLSSFPSTHDHGLEHWIGNIHGFENPNLLTY